MTVFKVIWPQRDLFQSFVLEKIITKIWRSFMIVFFGKTIIPWLTLTGYTINVVIPETPTLLQ